MEELIVGKLLADKGFLNRDDFVKALRYKTSEENSGRIITLGEAINVTCDSLFKRISIQVGELLVANGLATPEDMKVA